MTKRKHILRIISILDCIILTFQLNAQSPCVGGTTGTYSCNNIDFQSHIPLSTFGGSAGNDCWGWTAPNGNEYAIMGLNNGTAFVDVTNPATPTYIGKLPKPTGASNSSWQDIKVINNHAYIGTESNNHHIQVFDLMKLTTASGFPVTFTSDGSVNIGDGSSHNIVANFDAGYICGVGANQASGGLVFFDISNPKAPVFDGNFSAAGYSHDALCVVYRGPDTEYLGREICIGLNTNDFDIVDVTDRPSFDWISNTNYTNPQYTHQGWLTDDHKYLIFGDELDEKNNTTSKRKTYIFDISDLNNPVQHSTFLGATKSIDHNQYVKGSYLYQANYTEGMQVWDISDINSITQVASFDILPSTNGTTFNGAWSVYPYFKSGNILISGIGEGLFVVDPDLPHYTMEHTTSAVQTVCAGNSVSYSINLTEYDNFGSNVSLNLSPVPTGTVSTLSPSPVSPNSSVSFNINTTISANAGKYYLELTGNGSPAQKLSLGLIIIDDPDQVNLQSPFNNTTNTGTNFGFTWSNSPDADAYTLEIATDNAMSNIIFSEANILSESFVSPNVLNSGTQYYWWVKSVNQCDETPSSIFRFHTGGALPIELLDFSARPLTNSILLNWETETEAQNAGFEIERFDSNNPNNFEKIAWIEGKGNSQEIANYQLEDKKVKPNIEYFYRLRQLDFNGNETLSPIVSAKIEETTSGISIFPNPVDDKLTLNFENNLSNFENTELSIVNINGQEIFNQRINAKFTELNVNHLSSGVYSIQIIDNGEKYIKRFVKM